MKTRSITAIFIAAVYVGTVLLSIYVHKVFFDIFALLAMFGGSWEMCRAVSKRFTPALDIFVLLYAVLGYIAFFFIERYADTGLGIAGYLGVLVVLSAVCYLYCGCSKTKTTRNATSTVLCMIYPATIMTYMLSLNYFAPSFRVSAILLVFIVSCLTDTFAYLVGSTFKGPKLCPKISPKKTVSGAIGGLLGGIGGAMIVYALAYNNLLHASLFTSGTIATSIHFVMLGLLGSVFDQAGDLVASIIKRKCGIKDYGSFMPGHGGVLDRVDGMMFVGVITYIYMSFLAI